MRVGSVDDMAMNMTCHLVSIIARGNWQLARDCTLFIYLTYKLHVNSAGRALAGFEDTRKMVHSPNLDAIKDETNADLLEKVTHELFGLLCIKELSPTGSLKTFTDVMLASLLEYYEDVVNQCGVESVLIVKLHEVFGKHNVYPAQIREWGNKIKVSRAQKNALHRAPSGDITARIDFLHREQCRENKAAQADRATMKLEVQELRAENADVSNKATYKPYTHDIFLGTAEGNDEGDAHYHGSITSIIPSKEG